MWLWWEGQCLPACCHCQMSCHRCTWKSAIRLCIQHLISTCSCGDSRPNKCVLNLTIVWRCITSFSGWGENHFYIWSCTSLDTLVCKSDLCQDQAYSLHPLYIYSLLGFVFYVVLDIHCWQLPSLAQFPYRTIQIILCLYMSLAEVLAGFDVDPACCAYNGRRVYANHRAVIAMMRQCITIDMMCRSPSYEARIVKYCLRGFEVLIPSLRRSDVNPCVCGISRSPTLC